MAFAKLQSENWQVPVTTVQVAGVAPTSLL